MSSTGGRTFLDANALVYAVDEADPAKRDVARRLIAGIGPRGLVASSQVLAKFCVVAARKSATPMDAGAARQAVRELSRLPVVAVNAQLVVKATEPSQEAHFSLWDALIVEAASLGGCDRLVTEDLSHGACLLGVQIENPFARRRQLQSVPSPGHPGCWPVGRPNPPGTR